MALVGLLDYVTGNQIRVTLFYLVPILMLSWFGTRRDGLFFCVLGGLTWYLSDYLSLTSYSHPFIPVWNALMNTGFFVMTALLLNKLKTQMEAEKDLARVDNLTSLANSRGLYEIADRELEKARRSGKHLTLAYIDLDNFKPINDQLGHFVGDAALKEVGRILKTHTRSFDAPARLGGDEFCVLLPETESPQAVEILKRVHEFLDRSMAANGWPITFSIGLMCFKKPPATVDVMIRAADLLMYKVKKAGKNSLRQGEWSGEDLS
jgi:diguanylate cyclase (GGDEF)-like protein